MLSCRHNAGAATEPVPPLSFAREAERHADHPSAHYCAPTRANVSRLPSDRGGLPTAPLGFPGQPHHYGLLPPEQPPAMMHSHTGGELVSHLGVRVNSPPGLFGTSQQLGHQRASSRFCCQTRDMSPIDELQSRRGFSLLSRAAAGRLRSGHSGSSLHHWRQPDKFPWVPVVYSAAGRNQLGSSKSSTQPQGWGICAAVACDSWVTSPPSGPGPPVGFQSPSQSELSLYQKHSSHFFPNLPRSTPVFQFPLSLERAGPQAAPESTSSPATTREYSEAHPLSAGIPAKYRCKLSCNKNLASLRNPTTSSSPASTIAADSLHPPCSSIFLVPTPPSLFADEPARQEGGRTVRQRSSNVLSSFSSDSTPVSCFREGDGPCGSVFSDNLSNSFCRNGEAFPPFSADKGGCASFPYCEESCPVLSAQEGSCGDARSIVVPSFRRMAASDTDLVAGPSQEGGKKSQPLDFTFSTRGSTAYTVERKCFRGTPASVSGKRVTQSAPFSPPPLSAISADQLSPSGVCAPCTLSDTRQPVLRSFRRPASACLSRVRSLPVPLSAENTHSLSARVSETGRAFSLQCGRGAAVPVFLSPHRGTCSRVDSFSPSPTSFASASAGPGSLDPWVTAGSSGHSPLEAGTKAEGGEETVNTRSSSGRRHPGQSAAAAAVTCSSSAGSVCSLKKKAEDLEGGGKGARGREVACGDRTDQDEQEGLHERQTEICEKQQGDGPGSNENVTGGETTCQQCAVLLRTLVRTADSMQRQLEEVELKMLRLQQQAAFDRGRALPGLGVSAAFCGVATSFERGHLSEVRESTAREARGKSLPPGGAEAQEYKRERNPVPPSFLEVEAERAKAMRERDELRAECQRLRLSIVSLTQAREVLEGRVEELEKRLKQSFLGAGRCVSDQSSGTVEQAESRETCGELERRAPGNFSRLATGNSGRKTSGIEYGTVDTGREQAQERKGDSSTERKEDEFSQRTDQSAGEEQRRKVGAGLGEGETEQQLLRGDYGKSRLLSDCPQSKQESSIGQGDLQTEKEKAPLSRATLFPSSERSCWAVAEEEALPKVPSARENDGESTRSATDEALTAPGLQEDEGLLRPWKKRDDLRFPDCLRSGEPVGYSCISRTLDEVVAESPCPAVRQGEGAFHLDKEIIRRTGDDGDCLASSVSPSSGVRLDEAQDRLKDSEGRMSGGNVSDSVPPLLLSQLVEKGFLDSEWERPFRLPRSAARPSRSRISSSASQGKRREGRRLVTPSEVEDRKEGSAKGLPGKTGRDEAATDFPAGNEEQKHGTAVTSLETVGQDSRRTLGGSAFPRRTEAALVQGQEKAEGSNCLFSEDERSAGKAVRPSEEAGEATAARPAEERKGFLEQGEDRGTPSEGNGSAGRLRHRHCGSPAALAAQQLSLLQPRNSVFPRSEQGTSSEWMHLHEDHDNLSLPDKQVGGLRAPLSSVSRTGCRKDRKRSSASSPTARARTCSGQASERKPDVSSANRGLLDSPCRNEGKTRDAPRTHIATEAEQRTETHPLGGRKKDEEGVWVKEQGRGKFRCCSDCGAAQCTGETPCFSSFLRPRPGPSRRLGSVKSNRITDRDVLVAAEAECTGKKDGGEQGGEEGQLRGELASCRVETDTDDLDSTSSPEEFQHLHERAREPRHHRGESEVCKGQEGREETPQHSGYLQRELVHEEGSKTGSCVDTGAPRLTSPGPGCLPKTRLVPSISPRQGRRQGARSREPSVRSVHISPSLSSSFSSFSSPSSAPSSPLSVSLESPLLEEITMSPTH